MIIDVKINRDGEILYESPSEFAWLAVSVGVSNQDGSAFKQHGSLY